MSGKERERDGTGKDKLGTISTGKDEKVKKYRLRENHEPSSRREHLAHMLKIMYVHRQQALKMYLISRCHYDMDTGLARVGLQEEVWSTRLPRLGRPENEQRNLHLLAGEASEIKTK